MFILNLLQKINCKTYNNIFFFHLQVKLLIHKIMKIFIPENNQKPKEIYKELHDDFLNKALVCVLKLSIAIIENNKQNPWIILIPQKPNAVELIDLTTAEQHSLLEEINLISKILKTTFRADKINIATLGNKTPQLHIHIIARYKNPSMDINFPNALFGLKYEKMNPEEQKNRIKIFQDHIKKI
jgi:diadenosine tetraphosphate (Ap4A) HIT family hydrolase